MKYHNHVCFHLVRAQELSEEDSDSDDEDSADERKYMYYYFIILRLTQPISDCVGSNILYGLIIY